mmetsp:Transcript_98906/g.176223  ORF Transcript_98906/g.176223 Transcript_98906/m.176223 type:complete len:471 (+) Transcript_98906:75-1487(+)
MQRFLVLLLATSLSELQGVGNDDCWDKDYNYENCCSRLNGLPGCFDVVYSYHKCCLQDKSSRHADNSFDGMGVAEALMLAPTVAVPEDDINCFGKDLWDELAVALNSVARLEFTENGPVKFTKGVIGDLLRHRSLGLEECPMGVLAAAVFLLISHKQQEKLYEAFSKAVSILMRRIRVSVQAALSSRWPVYEQLAILDKTSSQKRESRSLGSWSRSLAALRHMPIPKTGGTTVENMGRRHGYPGWGVAFPAGVPDHPSADYWTNAPEDTFCIVRNPYIRITSAAGWRNVRGRREFNQWVQDHVPKVVEMMDKDNRNNIVLPSYNFVFDSNGVQQCKNVLRNEHLSKEFCNLLRTRHSEVNTSACIQELTKLPLNVNLKPKLSPDDLDNNSIELINRVFQKDFETFDYPMRESATPSRLWKALDKSWASRGFEVDDTKTRINVYHGRRWSFFSSASGRLDAVQKATAAMGR